MFFHVHQCVEEAFSICLLFWRKLKKLTAEVWRGVHVLRSTLNTMATILGITRNKLINPKQTLLEDLYEIVPFIGSSDRVKVFKTPFSSSAIQKPPLVVMGDAFHALDTLLVLKTLCIPAFLQSGFAYDRYTMGDQLYQPWWGYQGPLCLPSFSGGKQFLVDGKRVGPGSTDNDKWRRGCDTILRPGPFTNRVVNSIRLSGTGCYGTVRGVLENGVASVHNEYKLTNALPGLLTLLTQNTDRLFIWHKPTKDFQGRCLIALYQGVFSRLGITPAQSLETNYYQLPSLKPEIDRVLNDVPDSYWCRVDPSVGTRLFIQLRDWGARENLYQMLLKTQIDFSFLLGDEFGDAFQDINEGVLSFVAAVIQKREKITLERALEEATREYSLMPAYGNIGHLIKADGRQIANPIDGVDPENWMAQLRGEDTHHTPLAILKMVLAALVQPEARSSMSVHQWADSILEQASGFKGSWNQWVEFLGTLPKFPA